jgi:hypothetical protein
MVGISPPHSGRRAFVPHNAWWAECDDILPPLDGLFFQQVPSLPFHYGLRLRYLGQVTAKLMEVDLATGSEIELVHFDSANFPASPQFQVQTAFAAHFVAVLDFVKKAYYVEATFGDIPILRVRFANRFTRKAALTCVCWLGCSVDRILTITT